MESGLVKSVAVLRYSGLGVCGFFRRKALKFRTITVKLK